MKILIFTEGTILMHKNAIGHTREDIVQQIKNQESSVHDYGSYIPIGNAQKKLGEWQKTGHEILYLTSRRTPDEIRSIKEALNKHSFPKGKLVYRMGNEKYSDVAERVLPDVLIEDDCESIGGEKETTYLAVNKEKRKNIKYILVKEFSGINNVTLGE